MTAKEKAIELHDKYYRIFEGLGLDELPNKYAKEHALICVDEIIENHNRNFMSIPVFWQQVREEIIKL